MKRIKLNSALLLCFLIFSCSDSTGSSPNCEQNSGHIYVENTVKSFGVVNRKDLKNVCCKFKLKNTGSIPIVISKVDVSCKCISANITSDTLQPNKNLLLTITVNPNSSSGYINKVVFVNSDADNPVVLLRVKGKIID